MGAPAKLTAEHPKGAWGIAEAAGDFARGQLLDEIGAEGFVLAVGGVFRLKEDAGERS